MYGTLTLISYHESEPGACVHLFLFSRSSPWQPRGACKFTSNAASWVRRTTEREMYSIYARLYPLRGRGGVSRKEHTEGVDANVERGNSSTVTSTTRPSKPKICKNGRTSRKSASLSSKEVYYNGKGAANSKPKKVDSMASAIPRHQRAISKWAQLPVSANVLGAPNIATQTTPPPLSIVVSPNASQPFPMSQLTDDTLLRSTATSEIHWPYKETMPVVPPAVPTNADVSWAPPVPTLPPPPPLAQQSLTYNSQGTIHSEL